MRSQFRCASLACGVAAGWAACWFCLAPASAQGTTHPAARGIDGQAVASSTGGSPEGTTQDTDRQTLGRVQDAVQQLQQTVQQLSRAVETNVRNLDTLTRQQKILTDQVVEFGGQFGELRQAQQAVTDQLQSLDQQLFQLRDEQQVITDQLQTVNEQIGQISRSSGGSRVLRFDNIQDPQTQQELRQLVDRAKPRQGTLVVENKMLIGQYLSVNQQQVYVSAGETRQLEVPVGSVSTQLPGEAVVNWTIDAPAYRQSIQIRPQRVAPVPAVQTVYTSPPIYFWP